MKFFNSVIHSGFLHQPMLQLCLNVTELAAILTCCLISKLSQRKFGGWFRIYTKRTVQVFLRHFWLFSARMQRIDWPLMLQRVWQLPLQSMSKSLSEYLLYFIYFLFFKRKEMSGAPTVKEMTGEWEIELHWCFISLRTCTHKSKHSHGRKKVII